MERSHIITTIVIVCALATTALGDMSCMSCNFTIVNLGEEILTGDPACEQGGDGVQTFQEGCVACATVSVSLNISVGGLAGEAHSVARGCVEEMSDPECTDDAPKVLQTLDDILSTLNGNIVESKASTCTCDDEENCNSEGVTFGFDEEPESSSLECLQCASSNTRQIRMKLGENNRLCRKRPSKLTNTVMCEEGQVCAATAITVKTFDGLRRLSDASVVLRGCATVGNITMDECYLAKDHKESLMSMFGSEVKLAKIEGGICFCDGNLCNNMVHTTPLPTAPMCVQCTGVLSEVKQKALKQQLKAHLTDPDIACVTDPASYEPVMCQDGEVCASVQINTTHFGDVTLLPVSVFARGCVPQSLIAEAELDQCYHGDLHDPVISALFQDANFTYTDSSVCFCDERRKPGCNNKMADDMMEMRQTTPAPTTTPPPMCLDSADDCPDTRNYLLCSGDCKKYVRCLDQVVKRCGKGKWFDEVTRSCKANYLCYFHE